MPLPASGDEPPVGLIIGTNKKQALGNYATADMEQQVFVSRHLTLLPSPEALQQLIERDTASGSKTTPPGNDHHA